MTRSEAPRRRRLLAVALGSLASPWIGATAHETAGTVDLAGLMARMAAVAERHESFREERHLAALNAPLILTGTLHYWRPARMEKWTESPEREMLVVDGDRVQITLGNEPTQHLDLARAPELRALIDAFRAPLSGDLAALQRSFTVEASGTPDDWQLVLHPIEARAATILREVRLGGIGTDIRETIWSQANGDEHRMWTRPLP